MKEKCQVEVSPEAKELPEKKARQLTLFYWCQLAFYRVLSYSIWGNVKQLIMLMTWLNTLLVEM